MGEKYETYLCEYRYKGEAWGFQIQATSQEDAEARLKAMGWAKVNGMVGFTIPGWAPMWAVSLFVRILNLVGYRIP